MMNDIIECSNEKLQTLRSEMKDHADSGISMLRRLSKTTLEKSTTIQDVINAAPVLKEFISGIEKGQKLVLDISKETMNKIQNGDLKVMQTKEGVLKAEICDPNGVIKQHMNLKYEDFCNVPNPASLANMAQMMEMKQQLQVVIEQLETLSMAVQSVLVGQQNDRIALYKSGEQLYLEAKATKNSLMQQQLIVAALKSLEDARMQMIENIKTEITTIIAYDKRSIKLKSKELNERLDRINLTFDVINRASFLKAGIYFEQEETEAMMLSLEQYSLFLSEQINKNIKVLNDYDRSDKYIEGKWYERAIRIPQTINSLADKYEMDQQHLEMDYQTLNELGVISNE